MKTEDAQVDRFVWKCNLQHVNRDAELQKGIVTLASTGLEVQPLYEFVRGETTPVTTVREHLGAWSADSDEAIQKERERYNKIAREGNAKLDKLCYNIGEDI